MVPGSKKSQLGVELVNSSQNLFHFGSVILLPASRVRAQTQGEFLGPSHDSVWAQFWDYMPWVNSQGQEYGSSLMAEQDLGHRDAIHKTELE